MKMKKALAGFAFSILTAAAWALPTTQQVEAEVKQGNYTQAETMMNEVVTARPESAKAHYIYAEILAHNRNFAKAAEEAKKARSIDPAISFADPAKFRSFEELLTREQTRSTSNTVSRTPVNSNATTAAPQRTAPAPAERSSGMPSWIWIAGAAVLGFVAWRAMSRRNASAGAAMGGVAGAGMAPGNAAVAGGAAPYAPNAYANNPNAPYGAGVPAGRPGGGLLGTGMAVAGGVAGGMLIDRMLHRNDGNAASAGSAAGTGNGLEPGIFDNGSDAAAQQLADRPVDFGQGNDWDAGGGGGSFDVGSADDRGGDWN